MQIRICVAAAELNTGVYCTLPTQRYHQQQYPMALLHNSMVSGPSYILIKLIWKVNEQFECTPTCHTLQYSYYGSRTHVRHCGSQRTQINSLGFGAEIKTKIKSRNWPAPFIFISNTRCECRPSQVVLDTNGKKAHNSVIMLHLHLSIM